MLSPPPPSPPQMPAGLRDAHHNHNQNHDQHRIMDIILNPHAREARARQTLARLLHLPTQAACRV
jgi:hypothetical protein